MNPHSRTQGAVTLLVIMSLITLLVLLLGPSTWAAPSQSGLRQTVPSRTPSKPPSPTPTDVPPTPTPPPTLTPTDVPPTTAPPPTPTRTRRPRSEESPTSAPVTPTEEPTPAKLPETGGESHSSPLAWVFGILVLGLMVMSISRLGPSIHHPPE
jgi:LPXTG-motif cell wall-anchored protein